MGDMDVWLNALEYQSLYLPMLLGMVNKGPCKKEKKRQGRDENWAPLLVRIPSLSPSL